MRRQIAVLVAGLALTSAACGGDSSGPTSIAGTYTLRTVNNSSLPFITSQDETFKAEILSWVVTVNDNGTYSYVFQGRSTDNGVATVNTIVANGTYTVSGSTVELFDPADDSTLTGTLNGNSITFVVDATPVGVFTLQFVRS